MDLQKPNREKESFRILQLINANAKQILLFDEYTAPAISCLLDKYSLNFKMKELTFLQNINVLESPTS